MNYVLPTIKVVAPECDGGFKIINRADKTDADVLFDTELTGTTGTVATDGAITSDHIAPALSYNDLRALLTERGVPVPKHAKKADLEALVAALPPTE